MLGAIISPDDNGFNTPVVHELARCETAVAGVLTDDYEVPDLAYGRTIAVPTARPTDVPGTRTGRKLAPTAVRVPTATPPGKGLPSTIGSKGSEIQGRVG